MRWSAALLKHLCELGLAEDADDKTVETFIGEKIAAGELTFSKVTELNAQKDEDSDGISSAAKKKIGELVAASVQESVGTILDEKLANIAATLGGRPGTPRDSGGSDADNGKDASNGGGRIINPYGSDQVDDEVYRVFAGDGANAIPPDGHDSLERLTKDAQIRVKSAAERYEDTHSPAIRQKSYLTITGERKLEPQHEVTIQGVKQYHPSQLDLAIIGAYYKSVMVRHGIWHSLDNHSLDLLKFAYHRNKWVGTKSFRGLFPVKAPLVDDATSGGEEMVPDAFDAALITVALLHGELMPFVQLVNIPRGSSIDGSSMAALTLTWGTAEGTAVAEFDATGLISAFDNTIFEVNGVIQVGRHLEGDSPINIGAEVVNQFQNAYLKELDDVIASGDGTTQPQGLDLASGVGTANSTNGTSGPVTVDDAYSLFFSVGKQYRTEPNTSFVMNDTSYNRFISIAVGAGDERRVFGMTPADYMMLGLPVRINNDISNNVAMLGPLSRYRLYRRMGFTVDMTSEGITLLKARTRAILVTGRFAGKLTQGESFGKISDLQD